MKRSEESFAGHLEALRRARSFVMAVILIAAAVLTPPDVLSQLALAVPTWLLFELASPSRAVSRERARKAPLRQAKTPQRKNSSFRTSRPPRRAVVFLCRFFAGNRQDAARKISKIASL